MTRPGVTYCGVRVRADGKVWVDGRDFGSRLQQLRREGDLALWIWPGHHAWSGIGMRSYYPTRYMLVRWLDAGRVEVIEECEPGRHWLRERTRLIKRVAGTA